MWVRNSNLPHRNSFNYISTVYLKGGLKKMYNISGMFQTIIANITITITSWWFQPISKIWVKMGSSSPILGMKIKDIWVATTQINYVHLDSFWKTFPGKPEEFLPVFPPLSNHLGSAALAVQQTLQLKVCSWFPGSFTPWAGNQSPSNSTHHKKPPGRGTVKKPCK